MPVPFAPIIPMRSPRSTLAVTCFKTSCSPKLLPRSCSSISIISHLIVSLATRVYQKSRKYSLFLQTQQGFALKSLKSCLYLRNIRHALCFQIHIKAAASLFYSSTKGRIKPENMPLLSSLPRQRHIPLVCFSPRSYADGCARRHFPVLPAPLQRGTALHSCAPYIWAGCRFYFPRWQS